MVIISGKHRKNVYQRDNHQCVVCGDNKSLTIHHLFGQQGYPHLVHDEGNLVTLCNRCHKQYHRECKVVTPSTFVKWLRGRTINIKRVSVEWMNGAKRNLVFYDEPVDERRGLTNDDVKLTIVQVLGREIEMTEEELVDYMVSTFDTNRIQVENAILELSRGHRLFRFYEDGRTLVRVVELNMG